MLRPVGKTALRRRSATRRVLRAARLSPDEKAFLAANARYEITEAWTAADE
jgi:hypothetical protein